MGFESIKSDEHVTVPSMSAGEAPKHTKKEHEKHAYYIKTTYLDHGESTDMVCPHGELAWGAFYSEDYFNAVRVAVEKVLAAFPEGPGGTPRADAIEELRNAI